MASPVTAGPADSYIGSLLSIVSKSEMRYEGVLYHINPHDATLSLKNVRSFGTEGRRKDGHQVLPNEQVFEYIQFRGSDIKGLQVLPSPAPQDQDTSSVLNDPAIIESHYISPAPTTSTGALYTTSEGMTNHTSIGGLQNSLAKDSSPQFPPVRNLGSIGALLPPVARVNTSSVLPPMPGFGVPSTGIPPYVQQQPFVGPAQSLAALSMKQQMQYPAFNSSFASSTPNLPESCQPFMPPMALGSLISMPNLMTSSALPSNSASLSSPVTPNQVSKPEGVPTVTLNPTVLSKSPVTEFLERKSQYTERSNSILASGLQTESLPHTLPSNDGLSISKNLEEVKPSYAVSSQVVRNGPVNFSSLRPSGTVSEDVEVVKALTSESRPTYSKDNEAPISLLSTASAKKGLIQHKEVAFPSKKPQLWRGGDTKTRANTARQNNIVKVGSVQMWKKKDCGYTLAHEDSKSSYEKVVPGTTTRESMRGSSKEGKNKLNRRSLQSDKNGRSHGQEALNKLAGPSHRFNSVGDRRSQRIVTTVISRSTKFTEDFDFEAMNEKFNKEEIWSDLGKKMTDQLKGQAHAVEIEVVERDRGVAAVNSDIKPVYVKDDFFDSLSSEQPDRKLSEQRKIDIETFGNFKMVRANRGIQRAGRGTQLKGSNDGRGYGNAGRGRGQVQQPTWSRVARAAISSLADLGPSSI